MVGDFRGGGRGELEDLEPALELGLQFVGTFVGGGDKDPVGGEVVEVGAEVVQGGGAGGVDFIDELDTDEALQGAVLVVRRPLAEHVDGNILAVAMFAIQAEVANGGHVAAPGFMAGEEAGELHGEVAFAGAGGAGEEEAALQDGNAQSAAGVGGGVDLVPEPGEDAAEGGLDLDGAADEGVGLHKGVRG